MNRKLILMFGGVSIIAFILAIILSICLFILRFAIGYVSGWLLVHWFDVPGMISSWPTEMAIGVAWATLGIVKPFSLKRENSRE